MTPEQIKLLSESKSLLDIVESHQDSMFLLDEGTKGRTRPLKAEEAIDIFKKNCKQYNWDGQELYRGLSGNDSDYGILDPSKHDRKSATTENYYTMWIDNSKKWKSYPKRSKSLICTTDLTTAEGYGDAHLVIPFDGANIGICPEDDLWYSFKTILHPVNMFHLHDFNMFVWQVVRLLTDIKLGKSDLGKNLSFLLKKFKEVDEIIEQDPDKAKNILLERYTSDIVNILFEYKGLTGLMDYIFTPKTNGFETMPFKQFKNKRYGDREIWTDSPSLIIKTTQKDFLKMNT
jgi:hypothetical protein